MVANIPYFGDDSRRTYDSMTCEIFFGLKIVFGHRYTRVGLIDKIQQFDELLH